MVLRVISGVLMPNPGKQDSGQAVITFETNTVVGDAGQSDAEETGAAGVYNSIPCKVVSIREFTDDPTSIRINDIHLSNTQVKIIWAAPGAKLKEISYQFTGEVVI
jgi:hypothetical protein